MTMFVHDGHLKRPIRATATECAPIILLLSPENLNTPFVENLILVVGLTSSECFKQFYLLFDDQLIHSDKALQGPWHLWS